MQIDPKSQTCLTRIVNMIRKNTPQAENTLVYSDFPERHERS